LGQVREKLKGLATHVRESNHSKTKFVRGSIKTGKILGLVRKDSLPSKVTDRLDSKTDLFGYSLIPELVLHSGRLTPRKHHPENDHRD
jgi:hypothetical protein